MIYNSAGLYNLMNFGESYVKLCLFGTVCGILMDRLADRPHTTHSVAEFKVNALVIATQLLGHDGLQLT